MNPNGSPEMHYDYVIIGGGQAGIPLAYALAGAGQHVALAERKYLGGSCVNFGCTPTKAAIASARVAHLARRGAAFGLEIPVVTVNFPSVLARARDVALDSRKGLEAGFTETDNPRLLRGHARFLGRDAGAFRLEIGDETVSAAQVVLNTGTRSFIPPIPGIDAVDVLHAGNWMDRPQLPEHLAILGGGYIGLEMGQFYHRLGSRVTVIERTNKIAAHEDEDIASALRQLLEDEGIVFRLDTSVSRVDGTTLHIEHEGAHETIEASHLFVATGRTPNTDDLGLETVGVALAAHGYVCVDERLATNVEGIWASGDIRGGPLFTHTSWDDYRILESQLVGDGSRTTNRIVPYGVFTDPELGRVGMTEAEARQSDRPIKVARFDMVHNGKANEIGETKGFIKVIADAETGQLLGAAVLASEAAELVHMYIDVMNARAPYTVIRDAIHIHPTLAEAIQSAVAKLD